MDGTGVVVVEASSKHHAVSIGSDAHPLWGDDKPFQYEKVILPLAVVRVMPAMEPS
jgi:hypothetical protein